LSAAEYVLQGKKSSKTRAAGKKAPPKPAVKWAGTMQKAAKEGKSFLQRGKAKGKGKGKGKK
jgi:hypothetical protein